MPSKNNYHQVQPLEHVYGKHPKLDHTIYDHDQQPIQRLCGQELWRFQLIIYEQKTQSGIIEEIPQAVQHIIKIYS